MSERTLPLLNCCRQSLAERFNRVDEDGNREVCDYSYGADLHQLVHVAGEWRRLG